MKCAMCGQEAKTLTSNDQGIYVCAAYLAIPPQKGHPVYNKKGFLANESILSMAAYHAKLFPDGTYIFRIHDCNGGIRLRGDLNNENEVKEALQKLKVLEDALREFRCHIDRHYTTIEFA